MPERLASRAVTGAGTHTEPAAPACAHPIERTSGLVLVGDHPPPWGGISAHVSDLRALARASGIDVRVLDIGAGRLRPAPTDEVVPIANGAALALALTRATARGALLHAHVSGNNVRAWCVALAASSAPGRTAPPALLSVHSGLVPGFLARRAGHRLLARAACARAARVVCASARIAEALVDAGIPAARLEVLPAFAPSSGPQQAPPHAAVAARGRHRRLVGAALAPGRHYGGAILLDALARLAAVDADVGAIVWGPGTDGRELAAQAERACLTHRLSRLGELGRGASLAAMRLCDVFVRPTLADGDSVSVREALSLGRRVVATDVGHRPPGVRLVRPGDAVALAEGMRSAFDDPPPQAPALDAGPRLLTLWRSLLGADPEAR